MAGVPAALWFLGLFAAAPVLRNDERYGFSDRLRDALILGVAIPFALGFAHLLYPAACWIALAACLAVAYYRNAAWRPAHSVPAPPYLLIGALVAVAWPQLMRPLLDGDSLSYHLPNAASWAQNHSLWATATRYWWYPPASELFASALYSVGGAFALPWCGFGALALLGFRVASWAREDGAPPLLADALAACAVTAYPLAIQAGTLQNDVWLAAFWLETLWLLRAARRPATAMRAAAVTTLIKPQGWFLTALALLASRPPARVWLAAAAALALWAMHDAVLWNRALVTPATAVTGSVFGSTILAHGAPALALLDRVALAASPFAVVAFCAALLGPVVAEDRRFGWAALGSALLFFDTAVRLQHVGRAACHRRVAALRGAGGRGRHRDPDASGARTSRHRERAADRVGALWCVDHLRDLLERRAHAHRAAGRAARGRARSWGRSPAHRVAVRGGVRDHRRRDDVPCRTPSARLLC